MKCSSGWVMGRIQGKLHYSASRICLHSWGGRRGKGPGRGWGGDQRLFEKIKVFLKNQKHEPNIVEVTHLCIMHKVHTRSEKNDQNYLLGCLWPYLLGLSKAPSTLGYVGSHLHGHKRISKDNPHWKAIKTCAWQPPL
jgi:hypothetical protein